MMKHQQVQAASGLETPTPSKAKRKGRKALPVVWRYVDDRGKPQTRRFADEAARDAEITRLTDLGLVRGSKKAPTLAEALNKYLPVRTFYQRAPGATERVKPYVDSILLPRLGQRPIKSISTAELIDFRRDVIEERGKYAWDMLLIALSGALREASSRGWVRSADNPIANLPNYIPPYTAFINRQLAIQVQLAMPSRPQLDILLAGAKGWARLAILIMILAGLRSQEIRALLWRHIRIDRRNRFVHIDITRAAKFDGSIGDPKFPASKRTVTCEGQLYDILEAEHPGEDDADEFVVHQGMGMVTFSELHNAFLRMQIALGMGESVRNAHGRLIPKGLFSLHQLRHACVALWIWDGILDGLIRYWIGHANISVTLDTYGYLLDAYEAGSTTWNVAPPTPVEELPQEEEA